MCVDRLRYVVLCALVAGALTGCDSGTQQGLQVSCKNGTKPDNSGKCPTTDGRSGFGTVGGQSDFNNWGAGSDNSMNSWSGLGGGTDGMGSWSGRGADPWSNTLNPRMPTNPNTGMYPDPYSGANDPFVTSRFPDMTSNMPQSPGGPSSWENQPVLTPTPSLIPPSGGPPSGGLPMAPRVPPGEKETLSSVEWKALPAGIVTLPQAPPDGHGVVLAVHPANQPGLMVVQFGAPVSETTMEVGALTLSTELGMSVTVEIKWKLGTQTCVAKGTVTLRPQVFPGSCG